jgi:hypothetical protein
MKFLSSLSQVLCPDWDKATTARLVAGLRESVGTDADDPRFVELVGELSLSSERFRRLWARHDVQSPEGMPTCINHPQVGDLALIREKLAIGGATGSVARCLPRPTRHK